MTKVIEQAQDTLVISLKIGNQAYGLEYLFPEDIPNVNKWLEEVSIEMFRLMTDSEYRDSKK